jgi:hypothetical protein
MGNSAPVELYHVAPRGLRTSISRHGLDRALSAEIPVDGQNVGNFLYDDLRDAEAHANFASVASDLWVVDSSGLDLDADSYYDEEDVDEDDRLHGHSYRSAAVIEPERLRLLNA